MQVNRALKILARILYRNSYYDYLFVCQLNALVNIKLCNLNTLIDRHQRGHDPIGRGGIPCPNLSRNFSNSGSFSLIISAKRGGYCGSV